MIEGLADASHPFSARGGALVRSASRRKPFVVGGYALAAASRYLLTIAGRWPTVLFARLLTVRGRESIGSSRRDDQRRHTGGVARQGVGFHRAMITPGADRSLLAR